MLHLEAAERVSFEFSVKKMLNMPSIPLSEKEMTDSSHYFKISQVLKNDSEVRVSIKSKDGEVIKILFDGSAKSGDLSLIWDMDDNHGHKVKSGEYVCVSEVNGSTEEQILSCK
jgi:flagellar hook assembly protein FlgD